MSELNDMSCDELGDVAAELALGVLTGRERAEAIAHLDRCGACRENVRQLTMTGEELLGLLPASEPPPGFETSVIARLGLAAPGPAAGSRLRRVGRLLRPGQAGRPRPEPGSQAGRTRRMLAVAAVSLAAAAGLGGWGLRAATTQPAPATSAAQAPLRSAALETASHRLAGKIFLYNASPRWLYMAIDTGSGDGTVTCQLQTRNGRTITIGSFRLKGGYGHWGGPEPLQAATVTGVRLTTQAGNTLATANLSATR